MADNSPSSDGIDSTPTLPQPPTKLVRASERAIPDILGNVEPDDDNEIVLVASDLAKRLQKAKHTLAAAHWSIHEAVRAGRLRTALVAVEFPSWKNPGEPWQGGGRGTKSIPKGQPTLFDSFCVVATESLWSWWRAGETDNSTATAKVTASGPLASAIQWADEALTRLSGESDKPETLDSVCRGGALMEGFVKSPELAKKFAEISDAAKWSGDESRTVALRLDALRAAIVELRQSLVKKSAEPQPWEAKSAGEAIDNLRTAINGLFSFRQQARSGHLSGVHMYFRDVALQTIMRLAVSSVLQVPGISEGEFDKFRVDVVQFTNNRRKDDAEWNRLENALHEMADRMLAGREFARLVGASAGDVPQAQNQQADDAPQRPVGPSSDGGKFTLGDLLTSLQGSEQAFAANSRTADKVEREQGSISAQWWRIQAAVLVFQPHPAMMPGIDRIQLLCDELDNSDGLTAANVAKLRARVCREKPCTIDEANALSLFEAADVLDGGPARAQVDPFIARLLAGPADAELSARDLALLEAHQQQPISFATTQQEKQATGNSPTEAANNKLKLIRDFNRRLTTKPETNGATTPAIPTPTETPEPAALAGPSGFLGGAALADALGVHSSRRDAFFKQLERDRMSLGDENWQEVSNRRANTPRYQYRAD